LWFWKAEEQNQGVIRATLPPEAPVTSLFLASSRVWLLQVFLGFGCIIPSQSLSHMASPVSSVPSLLSLIRVFVIEFITPSEKLLRILLMVYMHPVLQFRLNLISRVLITSAKIIFSDKVTFIGSTVRRWTYLFEGFYPNPLQSSFPNGIALFF
jgi:hypothetical protein